MTTTEYDVVEFIEDEYECNCEDSWHCTCGDNQPGTITVNGRSGFGSYFYGINPGEQQIKFFVNVFGHELSFEDQYQAEQWLKLMFKNFKHVKVL